MVICVEFRRMEATAYEMTPKCQILSNIWGSLHYPQRLFYFYYNLCGNFVKRFRKTARLWRLRPFHRLERHTAGLSGGVAVSYKKDGVTKVTPSYGL